eukprot:869556-Amphidinium_carterae.1
MLHVSCQLEWFRFHFNCTVACRDSCSPPWKDYKPGMADLQTKLTFVNNIFEHKTTSRSSRSSLQYLNHPFPGLVHFPQMMQCQYHLLAFVHVHIGCEPTHGLGPLIPLVKAPPRCRHAPLRLARQQWPPKHARRVSDHV